MRRNPVNNFSFVIKYFPDQYKTQEICDKVFLENGGTIMFELNNINLDDVNFDESNPETIIHVGIMARCSRFTEGG